MSRSTLIIVPCFNEARRIAAAGFAPLIADPDISLLFVDDGSRDETAAVIERDLVAGNDRVFLQRLDRNRGKAEAVRAGLLRGLDEGYPLLGYTDADLSTPADELLRLVEAARDGRARLVMGARVATLGSRVARRPSRHYVGRLFATVAALGLSLRVYDTQCGAKIFAASETLRDALGRPFSNRWAFDVELLGRLLVPLSPDVEPLHPEEMLELPLGTWTDVAGSKIGLSDMAGAGLGLLRIAAQLRARRFLRNRG